MDTRKEYVRPTVESEDILEQTALLCTQSFDIRGTIPAPNCDLKNNAFYADYQGWSWCTVWPILQDEATCAGYQIGFS